MTIPAFHAAVTGFLAAHSGKPEEATEDEFVRALSEEIAAGRA